ncbi:MAG: DUF559 domain-containing protein [Gemmatimonadales bacterium]
MRCTTNSGSTTETRDEILSRRGLRVLRFTNKQVIDDVTRVLDAIRKAVHAMR